MPAPGRLTVVVQADPILTFTNPVAVPRGFGEANPTRPRSFDSMPDGRIVGVGTAGQVIGPGASELRVVVNWFEELKARVPANQ